MVRISGGILGEADDNLFNGYHSTPPIGLRDLWWEKLPWAGCMVGPATVTM